MQAQAAEDVFEWLQPSGRRPEGCCRSTELSGGRGQLPEVADYRLRRTMHAPCMPRLTLANVWRRQPESHESFELACRNAAGRCSTSVSMCSTRAVQRKQCRSDAEGRECSSPRTHRGAPAALWTLWSDASGHGRPIPPTLWLVLDATSAGSEGTVVLNVIVTHTRSRNTCNVKAVVGGPPRAGPRRRV